MRGQRPGARGDHERHLAAGEELLRAYSAGIDGLQIEPVPSSQTLFDGNPQRHVCAGERRITDRDRLERCGGEPNRSRRQPETDCKSNERFHQDHAKRLLSCDVYYSISLFER